MTKIKICGITNEADALFCAEAGADFLGFIFVPSSPRHIEPEKAGEIATAAARDGEPRRRSSAFFRMPRPITSARFATSSLSTSCNCTAARATTTSASSASPRSRRCTSATRCRTRTRRRPPRGCCSTRSTSGARGGTGRRFDWSLLATYERSKPFFLSGGLTPDNVVAAVSMVRPDAIDVASGVEASPGIKDHDKVARLFERVRRA